MLAHGVKCALTGGGTGNLTIGSAASGFRTPASAFMAGVPFYGTIYEGTLDAPTKWESGWFSHDGSGSLVRHIRDSTYDGTTFDDTSPAAVNFGSTANLICTQPPRSVLPTRLLSGSDMIGANDYGTSGINLPAGNTAVTTSTAFAYIQPILIETAMTLTELGFEIATAGAAGTIAYLGLAAPSADDGDPGIVLAATGSIATDVTGRVYGSVTPVFLPAGWYWVLMTFSGAPVCRGTINQSRVQTSGASFGVSYGSYVRNKQNGTIAFTVGADYWSGQGTFGATSAAAAPTPILR